MHVLPSVEMAGPRLPREKSYSSFIGSSLLRPVPEIGGKSDAAALRRRWIHQLANSLEDTDDGLVMGLELAFELIELLGQLFVRREHFAQLHEGADDVDSHFHGSR